jgi:hypothetical protein
MDPPFFPKRAQPLHTALQSVSHSLAGLLASGPVGLVTCRPGDLYEW